MEIGPDMIAALVSGIVGGIIGAARAQGGNTKSSLEKGQNAFTDLRKENGDLRDRVAKPEGKLELAVGLGLVRPSPPEKAEG